MNYLSFQKEKLSAFSLGTVQLGMAYGLGEFAVKPSNEEARSLLDCAMAGGVNVLDTADNYGDSEQIIGEWLATLPQEKRPFIVTKIGPLDHSSKEALRADILSKTDACIKRLGVASLDMLMVHIFQDYTQDPDTVREVFNELKACGKIRYSGLSVYSEDDYFAVAESGFDAVQIPLNVFDWRQIENGGIKAIADAGMAIFARSVFLQGLVFMSPDRLDPRMDFCRPYLEKYFALCDKMKISPAVLALSYVLSVSGVISVVLGCQIAAQVQDNCSLIEQVRPLNEEELAELHEAFADIDPRVIDPRLWFNRF